MAQITGVHAAGWHDMVQSWWQYVGYSPLLLLRNHANDLIGFDWLCSRICYPGLIVSAAPVVY